MNTTLATELPFLRSKPKYVSLGKFKAILISYKDITAFSELEDSNSSYNSKNRGPIKIRSPKAIFYNHVTDDRLRIPHLFINRSHPNVSSIQDISYKKSEYHKACLGHGNTPFKRQLLNTDIYSDAQKICVLIYQYISSFNNSGARDSTQSNFDNNKRCSLCRKFSIKTSYSFISEVWENNSKLSKIKFMPCLKCVSSRIKIEQSERHYALETLLIYDNIGGNSFDPKKIIRSNGELIYTGEYKI